MSSDKKNLIVYTLIGETLAKKTVANWLEFISRNSRNFIQCKIFSNFIAKISFQTLKSEPLAMLKRFITYELI